MKSRKVIGNATLVLGAALLFFSVAGASVVTYPIYAAFYYAAALGLSLITAGLLTLANL